MHTDTDRIVDWLVSGLELHASVFHVGQYCGDWRASTAGRGRASFHLILRGHCWLHIDRRKSVELGANDAVFLLRDLPHSLTAEPAPGPACAPRPMQPMNPPLDGGTGLACGFFDFDGLPAELLADAFPDCLLLRADTPALQSVKPLFALILAEAERENADASPLIARLTEMLFFYLLREMAQGEDIAAGLLAVASRPRFAPLLERLLRDPGRDWSADEMARLVNMSRASFFKHFIDTCGQPPAQFLLGLRMQIAARRLRGGESVLRAAEHVGYQSQAAFTRAFKKVIGEQPGAYQRTRLRSGTACPPATRTH
jgi:AraC-like DNA-binding protein